MAWMRKRDDEVVQLNERKVSSGYFEVNREDLDSYMSTIRTALKDVDYDTIVVTGVSGTSVGTLASYLLEKNLLIIRKEGDIKTSHAYMKGEGTLGRRWVFLDDFVSSGKTFNRVVSAVESIKRGAVHLSSNTILSSDFPSKFVGLVQYTHKIDRKAFVPARSDVGDDMFFDWSCLNDES